MPYFALRFPPPVITASPTSIGASRSHSSWMAGPPRVRIAPATPPPSRRCLLAALTTASTSRRVISLSTIRTLSSTTNRLPISIPLGSDDFGPIDFFHPAQGETMRLRVEIGHSILINDHRVITVPEVSHGIPNTDGCADAADMGLVNSVLPECFFKTGIVERAVAGLFAGDV